MSQIDSRRISASMQSQLTPSRVRSSRPWTVVNRCGLRLADHNPVEKLLSAQNE